MANVTNNKPFNLLQRVSGLYFQRNVIGFSGAVIVGGSFQLDHRSLVKNVINPILGALIGKPDFSNLFYVIEECPPNYTGR